MPFSCNYKLLAGYLSLAALFFVLVGVDTYFHPNNLPFGFWQFWSLKGSLGAAVVQSWWVIALGIGFNVHILYTFDGYKKKPLQLLAAGFGMSLWAGVMEEICFRWLIFFGTIYSAPALDWIFFGFTGHHPLQSLYQMLGAIANFFTFGYLKEYLLGGFGWSVAMALIMTNGKFRDGHGYQGLPGMTVSWFMGMYFFWITFTYGLIAAIVIHFLYDLAIFALVSFDALFEDRGVIERHRQRRIRRRDQELTISA